MARLSPDSVSIIIPTVNPGQHSMEQLLQSVYQEDSELEIVILSATASPIFADGRELMNRTHLTNLRLVYSGRLGKTAACNLGASLVHGTILAFLDDDAILSRGWLENVLASFSSEEVAAATGPILPVNKGLDEWLPASLDWLVGCNRWLGLNRACEVASAGGTNQVYRRDDFLKSGMFDERLGPKHIAGNEWHEIAEESELALRIQRCVGKKIVYNPKLVVYHQIQERKFSLGFIAQRSFQVGRTRKVLAAIRHKYRLRSIQVHQERLLLRTLVEITPFRIHKSPPRKVNWKSIVVPLFVLMFLGLGFLAARPKPFWQQESSRYIRLGRTEAFNAHSVWPS